MSKFHFLQSDLHSSLLYGDQVKAKEIIEIIRKHFVNGLLFKNCKNYRNLKNDLIISNLRNFNNLNSLMSII